MNFSLNSLSSGECLCFARVAASFLIAAFILECVGGAAPGGTVVTPLPERFPIDIQYTYDSQDRISGVTQSTGSAAYTFDASGNLVGINSTFSPALTLSGSQESVPSSSGNFVFNTTSNTAWDAVSDSSWLSIVHITGYGNGTVSFSVASNPETSVRSGIITVSAKGISRTYTVSQAGDLPSAVTKATNPSPASGATGVAIEPTFFFTPGQNVASQIFQISTDPSMFPTLAAETLAGNATSHSQAGLTLSEDTTYYWNILSRDSNNNGVPADIWSFTTGEEATFVMISPSSYSVTAGQASRTVSVTANTSWDVVSQANWILPNTGSGANSGSVLLTVLSNSSTSDRTGQVVIGGQTHTIHQSAGSTNFGTLSTGSYSSAIDVGSDGYVSRHFSLNSWSRLDIYTEGDRDTSGQLFDGGTLTLLNSPGEDDDAGEGLNFRHTGIYGPGNYLIEVDAPLGQGAVLRIEAHTNLILQPDQLIGKKANRLKGNNLYSLGSRAQRHSVKTKKLRPVRIAGALENDSEAEQAIRVRATRGNSKLSASYFYQGANVTSAVVTGRYLPEFTPNQRRSLSIKVKPGRKTVKRNETRNFHVTANSMVDFQRTDRITAAIKKLKGR